MRKSREEWQWRFAYFPVRLLDGSWFWWDDYVVRISREKPHGGQYIRSKVQRLYKRPPNQVSSERPNTGSLSRRS